MAMAKKQGEYINIYIYVLLTAWYNLTGLVVTKKNSVYWNWNWSKKNKKNTEIIW